MSKEKIGDLVTMYVAVVEAVRSFVNEHRDVVKDIAQAYVCWLINTGKFKGARINNLGPVGDVSVEVELEFGVASFCDHFTDVPPAASLDIRNVLCGGVFFYGEDNWLTIRPHQFQTHFIAKKERLQDIFKIIKPDVGYLNEKISYLDRECSESKNYLERKEREYEETKQLISILKEDK